jgi:hypothetical protein
MTSVADPSRKPVAPTEEMARRIGKLRIPAEKPLANPRSSPSSLGSQRRRWTILALKADFRPKSLRETPKAFQIGFGDREVWLSKSQLQVEVLSTHWDGGPHEVKVEKADLPRSG